MNSPGLNSERFRYAFVILLVLAVSAIFLTMIWSFLKALLLAAIFSGMLQPIFRKLVRFYRGRETPASLTTILIVLLLLLGPLTGFLGIVAAQALDVSHKAIPWVKEQLVAEHSLDYEKWITDRMPYLAEFIPNRAQVLETAANVAQKVGNFMVASASKATAGTAAFFLNLFIMLYAMFFFLIDGHKILDKILFYTPLRPEEDNRMIQRFASITRATIKGTIVIALIQGTLAGLGFYFAGIDGAAFWGTIMVVLSVVPGVGTPIVWIPTVIFLLATGQTTTGLLLGAWCGAVVGTVDNVLRPLLVGKDAQMPDLFILLGTLGGLFLFGPVGFIIGPIICGIFITAWDIYGTTFKEALPPVPPQPAHRPPAKPPGGQPGPQPGPPGAASEP